MNKVLSDERLGAKLRVTENRCVLFNFLTYVYLISSATTALNTRLRASYLNSALVRRRARALWKYNELVLTNHSTCISLHIL